MTEKTNEPQDILNDVQKMIRTPGRKRLKSELENQIDHYKNGVFPQFEIDIKGEDNVVKYTENDIKRFKVLYLTKLIDMPERLIREREGTMKEKEEMDKWLQNNL